MKKSKLIICLAFVCIVVFSFAFPCFADTWGSMHPNASQYLNIPFVSHTVTVPTTVTYYGINSNTYEDLLQVIDNAYEIGMFGGAVPLFITMYENSSHDDSAVTVHFTSPIRPEDGVSKYQGLQVTVDSNNRLQVRYYNDSGGYSTPYTFGWQLTTSGEFGASTGSYTQALQLSATGRKLLAVKNSNGEWDMGMSLTASSYSVEVFGFDGEANVYLTDILSEQAEALSQTTIEQPSYELNIGEIITAIPNGAKQIINNAFGFEIFGINVAGLLSVLLIVAIVGFVVKWLMSR